MKDREKRRRRLLKSMVPHNHYAGLPTGTGFMSGLIGSMETKAEGFAGYTPDEQLVWVSFRDACRRHDFSGRTCVFPGRSWRAVRRDPACMAELKVRWRAGNERFYADMLDAIASSALSDEEKELAVKRAKSFHRAVSLRTGFGCISGFSEVWASLSRGCRMANGQSWTMTFGHIG